MPSPVNHRDQIERWIRDRIASRGQGVGYAIQLSPIRPGPGQPPSAFGWLIVLTMKHPLLGTGDLYVPTQLPVLVPDKATIETVCTQALVRLDEAAAQVRDQIRNQAGNGQAQPGSLLPGIPRLPGT